MLNAMLDVTITSAKTSLQMAGGLFGAHDFTLDLASYLRKQLCQELTTRRPCGLPTRASRSVLSSTPTRARGRRSTIPLWARPSCHIPGCSAAVPRSSAHPRTGHTYSRSRRTSSRSGWTRCKWTRTRPSRRRFGRPLLFRPDNVAKPGLCLVINGKFYVHSAPAGISSEVCEKTWKAIAREDNDQEQHSSNVKCAERMSAFEQRDGAVLCFVTAAFTIVYRTPLLECHKAVRARCGGAQKCINSSWNWQPMMPKCTLPLPLRTTSTSCVLKYQRLCCSDTKA